MTKTRTCVGCHEALMPEALVRLVLGPDGELVVDPPGGLGGRGAWLHPRAECVERAVPRGLSRALRAEVKSSREAVAERLRVAGTRRLGGLFAAARGARKLAVGAEAVDDSLANGTASFVLVARDARASASSHRVAEALSTERALVALDKAELGRQVGRSEAGVVAVLDAGLGAALRFAAELSSFGDPRARSGAAVTEAS
jgi:predicted RNA-binding protein YlxR (DUF448 family)/ribosomal protein L7Ae-like RNA K-turn-binding protein